MSIHQKVRAAAKAASSWLFVPQEKKPPAEQVAAEPGGGRWHPHFGDICGLCFEDWLAQFPDQPEIRRSLLLITEERSGSEWLCQMLGETGKLGRPSEYLNAAWMRQFIHDYPEDVAEQVTVIKRVGTTQNGILAVKLHSWHMERLLHFGRLTTAFPMPVFVRLTRRDKLGQAISLVRARQTMAFHAHWDKSAAEHYDPTAIHEVLKGLIALSGRWTAYFSRNGVEPLHLDYEDLQRDPQAALRKIAWRAGVALPDADLERKAPALSIQRDEVSLEWRARFVAEMGNLDVFE